MQSRLFWVFAAASALVATALMSLPAPADVVGTVKSVNTDNNSLVITERGTNREIPITVSEKTAIRAGDDPKVDLIELRPGARVVIQDRVDAAAIELEDQLIGTVQSVAPRSRKLVITEDVSGKPYDIAVSDATSLEKTKGPNGVSAAFETIRFSDIEVGSHVVVNQSSGGPSRILVEKGPHDHPPGILA